MADPEWWGAAKGGESDCTVRHMSTLRTRVRLTAIEPDQERAFHERCMGPSGACGVGDDRERRGVVARARRSIESRIRQRALAGRTTPFTIPGPQVDTGCSTSKARRSVISPEPALLVRPVARGALDLNPLEQSVNNSLPNTRKQQVRARAKPGRRNPLSGAPPPSVVRQCVQCGTAPPVTLA
jgi:hypothetical protein